MFCFDLFAVLISNKQFRSIQLPLRSKIRCKIVLHLIKSHPYQMTLNHTKLRYNIREKSKVECADQKKTCEPNNIIRQIRIDRKYNVTDRNVWM